MYEFQCRNCQRVKESDYRTPPKCCGTEMRRLWSSTPIIYKTGGFYTTDRNR